MKNQVWIAVSVTLLTSLATQAETTSGKKVSASIQMLACSLKSTKDVKKPDTDCMISSSK